MKMQADGHKFETISRWLQVKTCYVTKHSKLYDFAEPCEIKNKKELLYFCFKGTIYPMNEILRLSYPIFFENKDGKTSFLSGYYSGYNGFYVEVDEYAESVRLWRETA